MSAPKDGGSAFPVPGFAWPNGNVEYPVPGMTLRAYFASQAMKGLLANRDLFATINEDMDPAICGRFARMFADALLAELAEGDGHGG